MTQTELPISAFGIQPEDLERHRRELTGYCYRMLGSVFEADDAVQDTMVRAWRAADRFEGRSSLRSWLYRIATNACLDMLRARGRRARPMDMGPSIRADSALPEMLPENAWVEPFPDHRLFDDTGDPAELAVRRATIRFAFVAALQYLPPRQRAVLILCEVLRWEATEVAALLDSTVASVNSALQRARATLSARHIDDLDFAEPTSTSPQEAKLLAEYVDAFEHYDIPRLVTLLRDDAIMSMPPYPMWLRGPLDIGAWFLGTGSECKGSRLVATRANGVTAFGSYRVDPAGGYSPWCIQLIDIEGDRIVGHHNFLDTKLFEVFGLPAHLDPVAVS
ncbi:MAG: sig7 [Ilumatobacteraceae bacterium]|nr:sig7 [Ilumatobacteraceae bacterium]